MNTGFDLDGDGLTTLDRICEGVDARAYNLFDTENVSFAERRGLSPATSTTLFMQPFSLYGPGFGPPVGRPLTLRLGARVDF